MWRKALKMAEAMKTFCHCGTGSSINVSLITWLTTYDTSQRLHLAYWRKGERRSTPVWKRQLQPCLGSYQTLTHVYNRRKTGGQKVTANLIMASAALQFFAFILALFGVFGAITATLLPNWKVNADVGSNIITAITQMQGLWMDCTWYSTGMFSCTLKYSILSLPVYIQAARTTMVLSCILSAFGICIATVGMKCTRLGGDRDTKSHTSFAGGVFFIIAGIFGLIPTAWYTREIIANFLDPTVPESSKHEPGGAVYIGFISAGLLITAGAIFGTSCFKKQQGAWIYPNKQQQQQLPAAQQENTTGYHLKDYV
ncbi:claudin-20 isoform X1 [Hemicordylus capensis]|uniref:claudin-20 isoform X1 n=2 Tax=Hemicordylus capensis TaxID=884348 RepID=UPI002303DC19|nr:claudin-20 isoform X1 [Hemicordylus capensis]XP_053149601.1 claudin-20 isoform X1 [Hemicordylus capensis]